MAITRSMTKKKTDAAARSKKINAIGNNTTFKAMAVGNIMGNWYKDQYDSLDSFYQRELQHRDVANHILRDRIEALEFNNQQMRRTISLNNTTITMGNSRIVSLEREVGFLDNFVQEVYTQHPDIAWEYRNRLQYDTVIPRDPEATEEESVGIPEEYAHLFEDSEEEAERQLQERMEDDGYF
ncbi:MAG: hypothetical protein [Grus japonensis parvo-like hybrid virus]|uniref:Uncharacterized protein n=1 Tax=Grus japonensis parvo-like hybrid virus TaxID=2794511 RepID=A0A8A4XDF5_9VIRU|nr:MAG: hypothetical protein [Grus japonensis parvo-like hybrid virus]